MPDLSNPEPHLLLFGPPNLLLGFPETSAPCCFSALLTQAAAGSSSLTSHSHSTPAPAPGASCLNTMSHLILLCLCTSWSLPRMPSLPYRTCHRLPPEWLILSCHKACLQWALNICLSRTLSPHSYHSSHTGLLVAPRTCQACSCLRAFALLFLLPEHPSSRYLQSVPSPYNLCSNVKFSNSVFRDHPTKNCSPAASPLYSSPAFSPCIVFLFYFIF